MMNSRDVIHLLLADNSQSYRRSLRVLLELEDYAVDEASNPDEVRTLLENTHPDLAILDLRMCDDNDANDMSGLEVAKYAAEFNVPCIILTAFPSTEVVRLALRSRGGKSLAVDFVTKSGEPQAVIDAIAGIVRRSHPLPIVAELEVDPARQVVRKKGEALALSRYQYNLLAYLYEQQGAVCPADKLIQVVYGEKVSPNEASADKRFERLIARLREKIEDDPSNPVYLLTVPGRGYRLAMPD